MCVGLDATGFSTDGPYKGALARDGQRVPFLFLADLILLSRWFASQFHVS